MKKYIALLRGINVGGKNKVTMSELKLLFEKLGFIDVITYINSGNVIFTSIGDLEKEIGEKCEKAINEQFNLNIPILVISLQDLSDALINAPIWWDKDKQSKHNAIFVMPPITSKEIVDQIGTSEYEQVYCYKNIIFWSAPIKTFSKTKMTRMTSTPIYNSVTIRNANTTKKLLQIALSEVD